MVRDGVRAAGQATTHSWTWSWWGVEFLSCGDHSTGTFTVILCTNGEPYFLVAGGKNCKKTFVALEVDNKIARRD